MKRFLLLALVPAVLASCEGTQSTPTTEATAPAQAEAQTAPPASGKLTAQDVGWSTDVNGSCKFVGGVTPTLNCTTSQSISAAGQAVNQYYTGVNVSNYTNKGIHITVTFIGKNWLGWRTTNVVPYYLPANSSHWFEAGIKPTQFFTDVDSIDTGNGTAFYSYSYYTH